MELPNLIKEAILQATISLKELNEGKIYGGVLENHLYKLARLSKVELYGIRKFGNETLTKECREIFQEAKEIYEILKSYEAHGLDDVQVNRIRILLQRIMGLEKLVSDQTKAMTRREVMRKGLLATAASAIFGTRAFVAEPQTSRPLQPRVAGPKPIYFLVDMNNSNEEFRRKVIQYELSSEEVWLNYNNHEEDYRKTRKGILKVPKGADWSHYPGGLAGNGIDNFFHYFVNGEIFKPQTTVQPTRGQTYIYETRDPIPNSGYNFVFLTTVALFGSDVPQTDEFEKIRNVMKARNIEFYIYAYDPKTNVEKSINLKDPKDIVPLAMVRAGSIEFKKDWERAVAAGLVSKLYITGSLDPKELRAKIQEWKQ